MYSPVTLLMSALNMGSLLGYYLASRSRNLVADTDIAAAAENYCMPN